MDNKDLIYNSQLNQFGKTYIKTLIQQLIKHRKKASSKLINSLKYEIRRDAEKILFIIKSEEYLNYVDKGVNGTERSRGSQFSYKTKKPPISEISKWARLKGLPKGAEFGIRENIFRFGIKPTNVIKETNDIMYRDFDKTIGRIIANNAETYIRNEFIKKGDINATITTI